MSDYIFEDMLTRRLKQVTVQIAESTPLGRGIACSVARKQVVARRHAPRGRVRSRVTIATALVAAGALASGTAYAGITLLQSVTQTDPGAAAIYEQNLGVVLDLSQTRDGVRLTLERAYADVNRVMLTYEVQTARTGTLFDGFATPTGEPLVTDSRGDVLPGYDASFQTDPRSNESVGIVVYDAASAAVNMGRLSLNIAVPGLRMQGTDGGTTSAGPFAFELTVPVSSGHSIAVGEADTVRGVAVVLDRVVASPSETRIYLTSSVGFESGEPYLVAHITGPDYDSRTAVITTPAELVDLGSTFRAPDGEEVVTFNNTLFGKRGRFTLTVDSIGSGTRVVGPWAFSFVAP